MFGKKNFAKARSGVVGNRFQIEKLELRRMLSGDIGNATDVCFVHEGEIFEAPETFVGLSRNNDSPELVADYVDDFNTPNPGANWQYLWNENGEFGTATNYSTMTWDSWRYRPTTASFPYLGATFGHSGPGLDDADSAGIERFAIAAFTVGEAGTYEIADSLISREGEFGDGIEVLVHVSNGTATQLLELAPTESGNFNTQLGNLNAGDTIYVGIGPDGPESGSGIGNDGFGLDFSIFRTAVPPVEVTIDLDTQRYVGDVSALDRDKFFTFHSSGGGSDQQLQDFRNEYDVALGRQFWGPLPYAVNQTGEVGVYPDVTPSTDQSVRPVEQIVQTSHPRDALRWDTDLQAAAEWVTTYYTTVASSVPEFFEPINEPFVHAGDSEFSDAPDSEAMRLRMAELFAAIGEAVDNTPALANMNIVGYSSAWPSVELWDFGHWESRMKMFMDVAGDYMDAFSTHLYDGINVTGQNNRRSGSNSEAILDLIETYSFTKWGTVKPHAITEYGGITDGYGEAYSDIRSAQSIRSVNQIMFNLLERQDDLLISIPFITDKATWYLDTENDCHPYSAALFRPSDPSATDCGAGGFEYTWRVNFFELWQDVNGDRGLIETSDPDIQAQLFVDGNTAYVAVNNLSDHSESIDLQFVSGLDGFQDVEVRQLEVPVDAALEPTYTENTLTTAPSSLSLDAGGTAVLVYNFDGPLEFSQTVQSQKYYTSQHLESIVADQAITFDFNGVETADEGTATLRMGIGRGHDVSKAPVVTVNGTAVDVPGDWAGYDQANRDDFFGVIEIPVPISLLNADNTVSVTFPDSGGRVSSMILNVEAIESAPELNDVAVNLGDASRSNVNQLTLEFAGDVDFGSEAFSVVQRSDALGATGTAVATSFNTAFDAGTTTVTLTFDSHTRNSAGSLVDGNYQLTVNASEVTASGFGTSMQEDFIFGDSADETFYSLFGDADGNRIVNVFDLLRFRQAFQSNSGDTNYVSTLDYQANGSINVFDLLEFRNRYLKQMAFV